MTSLTRSRGYLPHLETQEAIYFVTFRLADSLPKEFVLQLLKQRDIIEKARLAGTTKPGDLSHLRELRALMRKAERCLDRGLGRCHLRDFRVARIVAEALRHFHGQRYRPFAWCVMPNHVHVLFSRCESTPSMPFCILGSPIPLTRQIRFLLAQALFGSANISITWFGISPLSKKSHSTFETIPKEPDCSTGPGSKPCSSFPSAFRSAPASRRPLSLFFLVAPPILAKTASTRS